MTTECEILDRAAERIAAEKRGLQREREAFEAFRASVSRTQTTTDEGGTRTGTLLEAYRETVMSTPDFEAAYDEPVSESLETEFTPSLAESLQEDEPVTQQFKRDLLVATNAAIEPRTGFIRVLEAEHESIRTVRETVLDIEDTLRELPACSFRRLQFDRFVDVWETYEHAVERCDRRSEQRQRHIANQRAIDGADVEAHALNEYLYDDLETEFPALRALAGTRRRIERCRREPTDPATHTPDGTGDCGLEASSD
ncbi:DUF7260 family protein [Natronomonas amylolytica]|uniref:DUF7260 family protein n=1 Tax=Natronomonas amylolytica TaxID=3108498 RepID=UPI003008C378